MPRTAADSGLLSGDEESSRLRSSSDEGLRYEPGGDGCGPPRRGCGDRCCDCWRRCDGCLRSTWGCCGALCCDIGPELCKLLCYPPLPSRIASKLAFAPPPPSYDVRRLSLIHI